MSSFYRVVAVLLRKDPVKLLEKVALSIQFYTPLEIHSLKSLTYLSGHLPKLTNLEFKVFGKGQYELNSSENEKKDERD